MTEERVELRCPDYYTPPPNDDPDRIIHLEASWAAVAIGAVDQKDAAMSELDHKFASRPVIVGDWDIGESKWWMTSARAPQCVCPHLDKFAVMPRLAMAHMPGLQVCPDCFPALIKVSILAYEDIRCRRCDRELTSATMYIRALIFAARMMFANVCQRCARKFDGASPAWLSRSQWGKHPYAARVPRDISIDEAIAEWRASGHLVERDSQPKPNDR